jgi:hypothetical protein
MVNPFESITPISISKFFIENLLYIFDELDIKKYAATKNSPTPSHCPTDMGLSNMKIPAKQGTRSPAVPNIADSATVPDCRAINPKPVESKSIVPEKSDIAAVGVLQ